MIKIDLTGQRFGKLKIIKLTPNRTKARASVWEALCDCGNTSYPNTANLKNGLSQSCGCMSLAAIMNRVKYIINTSDGSKKECIECRELLPTNVFGKDSRAVCGLRGECKKCRIPISKKRYDSRDPEMWSSKARNIKLKSKYGIDATEYNKLLAAQCGQCAVCGGSSSPRKNFDVDHYHATGRVRGLLCRRCNNVLGQFNEDADIIIAAALYIKNWSDN